ncbi:MAG TPA: hypothetical protein VEN28_08300, partial [Burkholderiaceae bacterium]|nr:hypothetical protein [Burkholderiaceae bacterium]
VRMNMSDTTAALTIGEPLAVIRAATGAFAGLIVRNGNQIQSLNADLGGATNLFTVDPASFVSAGNVFGSALPGLWIFVDGRTVYGVNLATPANRAPLATLATGETLVSHPVGDGTSGYFAINAAATGRVLRVTGALAPSDVTTLDAPAQYLAVTSSRVVASLASTPVRIVSAPKTGGTMQAVHTASVGETALTLLTSGENVYLSKLAIGIGALGSSTVIVRSDGTNAQTLANTRVMHGISPTVVSVSQGGLSQSYAIVLADGVSAIGDFAGATVRAVEGATRNTLLTYGTFPATPSGTVFFMSAAPLQYGQTGLMSFFGMSSNSASDLYFMKSNTAGLQRVTTFVTAM